MFPAGHNTILGMDAVGMSRETILAAGKKIWDGGLPVLDDLHVISYGWARKDKVNNYVELIHQLKPGVTMIIMHCTIPTETFGRLTASGDSRLGDVEGVTSPEFKKALEEGIILTTFRELKQRRDALKK